MRDLVSYPAGADLALSGGGIDADGEKSGSNARLLDTHILLWRSQANPRLLESAQIEIKAADVRDLP